MGSLIQNISVQNVLQHLFSGLGSILFAITVDSRELNIPTVAEQKSRSQEIIIAVPTVSKGRKATGSKRKQIISFEDNETTESPNNSVSSPIPVLQSKSLPSSCLKYKEPALRNFYRSEASSMDSIIDQQLAETLEAYDIVHSSSPRAEETDYLEPESPSSIKMCGSLPSTDSMKETEESSISKIINSTSSTSNVTSTTTTTTTNSSRELSRNSSSNSLINAIHQVNGNVMQRLGANTESSVEDPKLRQLEDRCTSLEKQVAELTL